MTDIKMVHEGRYIDLVERNSWEFVARKGIQGIVAVIPFIEDDIILLTQYRAPLDRWIVELPAGLAGDEDSAESLETAAIRELEEETGYRPGRLIHLFDGPPSPGLSSEVVTWYQGEDLVKVGDGGGVEKERIHVHRVPLAEVEQWLEGKQREGCLVDPKIYLGLYLGLKRSLRKVP